MHQRICLGGAIARRTRLHKELASLFETAFNPLEPHTMFPLNDASHPGGMHHVG
jgi:hypothetical protein